MKNKVIWFFLTIGILAVLAFVFVEDKTEEHMQAEMQKFNEFADNARKIASGSVKADSETKQDTPSNLLSNEELASVVNAGLPKLSKPISDYGRYISDKWVRDIKSAINIQDGLKDGGLLNIIQEKITLEENLDSRLITVVAEMNASVALMTAADSDLTVDQLLNRNQIRQFVEQILADKQQARTDLEDNLRNLLSQIEYESLEASLQSRVNNVSLNFVDKYEGQINSYVSDLNDFQKAELTKVFEEFRSTEITGVSIGAMINNKGGNHLITDDPASIQFIASLQQSVQSQLSPQQLETFMNGVRSEISDANLGLE